MLGLIQLELGADRAQVLLELAVAGLVGRVGEAGDDEILDLMKDMIKERVSDKKEILILEEMLDGVHTTLKVTQDN